MDDNTQALTLLDIENKLSEMTKPTTLTIKNVGSFSYHLNNNDTLSVTGRVFFENTAYDFGALMTNVNGEWMFVANTVSLVRLPAKDRRAILHELAERINAEPITAPDNQALLQQRQWFIEARQLEHHVKEARRYLQSIHEEIERYHLRMLDRTNELQAAQHRYEEHLKTAPTGIELDEI